MYRSLLPDFERVLGDTDKRTEAVRETLAALLKSRR